MTALASQWLIDTFFYTGLLIALVLLLRRPVARYCGPTIAYALWALPFVRFIMPPLVLPASMAPVAGHWPPAAEALPASAMAGATTPPPGMALLDGLIGVWLLGALAFLIWRAREYVQMRRALLAEARAVGESGKVRLVETPAVSAPVAFGICDKVVALPPGFMASYDRQARDLAIAHELAHHRGLDLLVNILAQPVLALHWFNPLAWWGWRAMRNDQEAACDARVVANSAKSERSAYAQVIASFAARGHALDELALAAPMACPVLGEKSIIHRLRILSMAKVPASRRRLGLALVATCMLALPATASITYAQSEVAAARLAPVTPLPLASPVASGAPGALALPSPSPSPPPSPAEPPVPAADLEVPDRAPAVSGNLNQGNLNRVGRSIHLIRINHAVGALEQVMVVVDEAGISHMELRCAAFVGVAGLEADTRGRSGDALCGQSMAAYALASLPVPAYANDPVLQARHSQALEAIGEAIEEMIVHETSARAVIDFGGAGQPAAPPILRFMHVNSIQLRRDASQDEQTNKAREAASLPV